ncbi:unnamed protein product [Ophioblennius macclurei]
MASTRMKLRVRRRNNVTAEGEGGGAQEEEAVAAVASAPPGRRRESSRRKSKVPPPAAAVPEATVTTAAEETSPDSKCPICLDRFDNVAFLDRCLHRFCFPCIQEWSHSKAECPLCKQPFASILHSVRSEDDFKEYTLRPPPAGRGVAATVAMVAAMATVSRSSHQMRLTLRRHRAADGSESTTAAASGRRRGRERSGARRAEEGGAGVWEWYLDSPPLPRRPANVADEPVVQPEVSMEERGVIFEGLAGLEGVETPVAPSDRVSRRLMTRLAARQRLQREGGTPQRLREREALALRRALYRCGVRVRGVAGASGDSAQQQRDVSAAGFRRSPALLSRLRPWLRRELTVLYGTHGSLVEIVQRIITVRIARHGLEDPPAIEEELRPFLLARTEHFLHELASFARSPLGMDSYDLQAVYEPPSTVSDLDWISSSSDSSSVIAISEEDEEVAAGGPEEARLTEAGASNEDGCLSLSGWDDETPGPSYSSAAADQSCSLTSPAVTPPPMEVEEKGGEEEECLIVGYKKPIAERTPELVQLSSDTEEEQQEAKLQPPEATPAPPEPPPLSLLPTIPPSTSAASREEQKAGEQGGGEEAGPRAHSWSDSSRNSACTLSPATPPTGGGGGGNKRQRETASWREKRRKRRKKRRRRGTIYSPNRSIYPAMMRNHRHSSGESSSPPSPAPSSSWEVSSLSSSDSSSSSSPLSFSPPPPPQTPPPSTCDSGCRGEKPSGKRKYKSRHLDNDMTDPTWRLRRRRRGRDSRDRKRNREERSPSVEIIYEGTVAPGDADLPGAKRRRRRRHRVQRSSSPVIITLDSDSSNGGSPLDFSHLPQLPLVPSASVGGTLEAQIGELPVDILDRGSDGLEAELAGHREVVRLIPSDGSEHDVDVEKVDTSAKDDVSACALDAPGPVGAAGDNRDGPEQDRPRPQRSDRNPLLVPQKSQLETKVPVTLDPNSFPEGRAWCHRILCEMGMPSQPDGWFFQWPPDPTASQTALSSDTQLKDRVENRVRMEDPIQKGDGVRTAAQVRTSGQDVPPLLRQASPVGSYHRNTPPPLKHKDSGSPTCSPLPTAARPLIPLEPPNDKLPTSPFKVGKLCPPQNPETGFLLQSPSEAPRGSPSGIHSPAGDPLDLHPEGLRAADRPPSVGTSLVLPTEVNHTSSPSTALPSHRDHQLECPPCLEPHPLPL